MAAVDHLVVLRKMRQLAVHGKLAPYRRGTVELDGGETGWRGKLSRLEIQGGKLIVTLDWRLRRDGTGWRKDAVRVVPVPLSRFHSLHFSSRRNNPLDEFLDGCSIGLEGETGWLLIHPA